MGLLMQIIGVFALIASLIYSIIAIRKGVPNTVAIILLIVGASLIRIGRDIYKNNKKS